MAQSGTALMSMIKTDQGGCADKIGVNRLSHHQLFSSIVRMKPSIAILNFGAHGVDDGDVFSVINEMHDQITQVSKQ